MTWLSRSYDFEGWVAGIRTSNGDCEVGISVVNPEELMQKTDGLNLKAPAAELKTSLVHALDHV